MHIHFLVLIVLSFSSVALSNLAVTVPCLPHIEYIPGARPQSPQAYVRDQLDVDRLLSPGDYILPAYINTWSLRSTTLNESVRAVGVISPPENQVAGDESSLLTSTRQAEERRCVTGAASTICVTLAAVLFNPSANETARFNSAKDCVMEAAQMWAEVFPSTVEIRMRFDWASQGKQVLGSAKPSETFWGGACKPGLAPQLYVPAVLNSVTGTDFNAGAGVLDHHVVLSLSSDQDWFFGNKGDDPPADLYDCLSLALHEMAHGLFMFSFIDVVDSRGSFRPGLGTGDFVDGNLIGTSLRTPTQFDRFLVGSSGNALVNSCQDESAFYGDLTTGVRFVDDVAAERTNFAMFSPPTYQPGSSSMHFLEDAAARGADCEGNGLSAADPTQCSALMTPYINMGEREHEIGENTLRMMRSHLGSARGNLGTCKFNPWDPNL